MVDQIAPESDAAGALPTPSSRSGERDQHFLLALSFFLLSGFAALIYRTAWTGPVDAASAPAAGPTSSSQGTEPSADPGRFTRLGYNFEVSRRTQPRVSWIAVAALILFGEGLWACHRDDLTSQSEASPPARAVRSSRDRDPARPDIILISLDTLRADRLHCYGNRRDTSPRIDELARDGVLFGRAFSSAPWTLPSHLSLFTSQYPGRFFHGIDVSSPKGETEFNHPVVFQLDAMDPSLPAFLAGAGYDTVGFHGGGYVARSFGFHHGFRRYESARSRILDDAEQYLDRATRDDKPFFLFLHTYIPHRPYRFEGVYGDPDHRPPGLEGYDPVMHTIDGAALTPLDPDKPLYGWTPNPEQRDYFLAVYDGGVREADEFVGAVLDLLDELDVYDESLIIVLSDHGEEFWEHIPEGSPEHNHSLFDELLHVPLIVKFPGRAHAGTRIDQLTRLVDVLPTILDLTGIEPWGPELVGTSLLGLLDGKLEKAPRELYAGYTYLGPMRYGLRTERYKYIYAPVSRSFTPHFAVPRHALYDLAWDPGEQQNIALTHPRIARAMRAKLTKYRDIDIPYRLEVGDNAMGKRTRKALAALGLRRYERRIRLGRQPSEPLADPDPDTLERLRTLGYVR